MRIVSVNASLPREVIWNGKRITTGIFKEPVEGPVTLRTLNLDGDRQADLSVHGGPSKAAYVYLAEHYEYWRSELPQTTLPWGMFGENLTAEWLREDAVNIGDRYRVGSAEVMVTEPRLHGVTVADITRLYAYDKTNRDLLDRAVQVPALPEGWRGYFRDRIAKLSGPGTPRAGL